MDRSGYILEQLLITLGICAFLIPITVVILGVLVSSLHVSSVIQDEVSLAQLRHVINVSDEFSLEGNELSFVHHEDHQRLALRNGNGDPRVKGTVWAAGGDRNRKIIRFSDIR